ncbi:hypothetical protein BDW75DRAFT_219901 [Aspergillus navahoensis]
MRDLANRHQSKRYKIRLFRREEVQAAKEQINPREPPKPFWKSLWKSKTGNPRLINS